MPVPAPQHFQPNQRMANQSPNSSYTLPKDFLSGPGPKQLVQKIDFPKINLPEYQGLYAVVIDNALTREECNGLVCAAEAHSGGTWEPAMVNIGGGHQALMPNTRDCGRIIWDDRDVVEKLWLRVKDSVPEVEYLVGRPEVTGLGPVRRKEMLRMTRLNERMRFLKYEKAQYFRRKSIRGGFQPCRCHGDSRKVLLLKSHQHTWTAPS